MINILDTNYYYLESIQYVSTRENQKKILIRFVVESSKI